jgi:hypothetical protein
LAGYPACLNSLTLIQHGADTRYHSALNLAPNSLIFCKSIEKNDIIDPTKFEIPMTNTSRENRGTIRPQQYSVTDVPLCPPISGSLSTNLHPWPSGNNGHTWERQRYYVCRDLDTGCPVYEKDLPLDNCHLLEGILEDRPRLHIGHTGFGGVGKEPGVRS